MTDHPFALLRPFADSLDVQFLIKKDNVGTDADIAHAASASQLVSLQQMHGGTAVIVREQSSRIIQADGLATDVAGLTLTIRFADCQGLVVYAPQKNVVALIHAGWRGVIADIIPHTFQLLKKEWGIEASETVVGIGPSLCEKCADFTDPSIEAGSLADFTHGTHIDLRAAADDQLKNIGVPATSIERSKDCTRCMPEKYWTYRGGHREEVKKGLINCFAVTLRK